MVEVLHNNGISICRVPGSTSYLVVLPRLVTPKVNLCLNVGKRKIAKVVQITLQKVSLVFEAYINYIYIV